MPEEAKTLKELITIHQKTIPQLHKVIERMLLNNPDLTIFENGVAVGMNLEKILAIGIMDFLCFAFNKGDIGYIRFYPTN